MKIAKEQAARIRKMQSRLVYARRNLRAEAHLFTTPAALNGFILLLEDGVKPRRRLRGAPPVIRVGGV